MSYRHYRCDGTICSRWPHKYMLAVVVRGCDTMVQEERLPPFTGVEPPEAEAGPHVRHALVRFRTTRVSEEDSAEFADAGDDTIELALTEADMLALSRAAEEEHVEISPGTSALIATGVLRDQSTQSRRWLPVLASL